MGSGGRPKGVGSGSIREVGFEEDKDRMGQKYGGTFVSCVAGALQLFVCSAGRGRGYFEDRGQEREHGDRQTRLLFGSDMSETLCRIQSCTHDRNRNSKTFYRARRVGWRGQT